MKMTDNKCRRVLKGPPLVNPILKQSFGILMFDSLEKKNKSLNEVAFINVENKQQLTFKDLFNKSMYIARLLKDLLQEQIDSKLEEKKNPNIAIYCENHLEFFIPVIGCLFAGYPIVNISHTYNNFEIFNALNITKPSVIFCSRQTKEKMHSVYKESSTKLNYIKKIFVLEEIDYEVIDLINFKPISLKTDDVAVIMFSSGTSGMPKAVMTTHYNINYFYSLFNDPNDINSLLRKFLLVLPFTHAYGFFIILLSICMGNCTHFMVKYNNDGFLNAIQEYKIQTIPMVPPLMVWLSKTEKLNKYDLSSLKNVFCAAAPLPKTVEDNVKKRFKINNIKIYQMYGMTELSYSVISIPLNCQKSGSVGKIIPEGKLKIRDIKNHKKLLGPNEIGELLIAGPFVAKGYYGNLNDTKCTFMADGFLTTGDLGYYDQEGYLYIVDHVKELIKYNGFQVHPAELEGLLMTHGDIADAAVVGLRNEEHGELPVAFVVKKEGSTLSEEEIQDFIKSIVSFPKYLRGGVRFVTLIPKSPNGKLLRRKLRDLIN